MSLPLGILGGGQLGRMTALAAARLDVPVRFLVPKPSGPVAPFADVTVADWSDPAVVTAWARRCSVVTVESEWAPAEHVPEGVPVRPGPATLVAVRHKGRQRAALAAAGLPQPDHVRAATEAEALAAFAEFGGAAVCKRFEGSYDGYGNATCRSEGDVRSAWTDLAAEDGLLVEAFVPFEAEAAVTVARRPGGAAVAYPVVRSEHRDHRLWTATVPAGLGEDVEAEARRVARDTVEALGAVGVATVELFVTDGGVLVNEVAPRPHNTAHLTLDASHTSQFENHVRAVLDWPLGDPGLRVPAACMVNVLGARSGKAAPDLAGVLAAPAASLHLYGKADVRPDRKMGHVTATAASVDDARQRAKAAAAAVRL